MGKLDGINAIDLWQLLPGPMLSVMMVDRSAPPAVEAARPFDAAFGPTGAMARHAAHQPAVLALCDFVSVDEDLEGTPVVPGAPSADRAPALTGVAAAEPRDG